MSTKNDKRLRQDLTSTANLAHHHSATICEICTLNTFAENYYLILDTQEEIDKLRPPSQHVSFGNNDNSLYVIDSSCLNSIYYLLMNLQEAELSEFEAYLAVCRNLIEKLSRLIDVMSSAELKEQAAHDFEASYNDIMILYESTQPSVDAKVYKRARWLGRGTDRTNIKEDIYKLIYAYISRVIHLSNMDTLLSPKEDRYFIKAYMLMSVAKLYHYTLMELDYLSAESRELHKKCYIALEQSWKNKEVSAENLIMCTSFYENRRGKNGNKVVEDYKRALQNAFDMYKLQNAHVVPRIDIV